MASAVRFRGLSQKSKRVHSSVAAPPAVTRRPHHRALNDQCNALRHELDDLSRALYEAAQVQRRLCGPRSLRVGSYGFASEIFPVRHLTGDFITLLPLKSDLLFAIGDIGGKGLMAGMWFTHVVGTIRRNMATLGDPAAVVSAVDHDLRVSGLETPLTTLFVARLDLASGELTYCNAGHPPALLARNSLVQELSAGGPVLASISEASFVNGTARLCPGDTLLAYSDGIVEGRNKSGVEFGTKGLLQAVAVASPDPGATLFSVLAAVEGFVESRQHEDDIALLVLHRFGGCEIH